MESSKFVRTPISTSQKLSKDDKEQEVDQHLHISMIGNLLYLTASRLDICYSVGVCAQYQASPKESHLKAIKRILKYVCHTSEYGNYFSKNSNTHLCGYSDADSV
jgi:hypothetical protein